MQNTNKTSTAKKSKKRSTMQKIGKSIKDTFIEMSSSLAGWIDDAGNQFAGKKKKSSSTAKKTSGTTQNKSSTSNETLTK